MTTCALTEKAIVLKPEDDVAVARTPVSAGTVLEDGPVRIEVRADIRPGHKIARRARAVGEAISGTTAASARAITSPSSPGSTARPA
jgi:hypothetical protein